MPNHSSTLARPGRAAIRESDIRSRIAFRRDYRDKIANGRFKVYCSECGDRLTKLSDDAWCVVSTPGAGILVRHTTCPKEAS